MAAGDKPSTAETPPSPRLRRRWLVNLALLAAVVALAGFFLLHRQQQETAVGPPLTAVAPDQVSRVRIERPGQPAIVLEKHDARWRLIAPLKARANLHSVRQTLALAQARSELALAATDAGSYGLDTPQARVWLDDALIEFGALHPFRSQVYARHRNTVHLVAAAALGPALRAPGHFIDGRLIEPEQRIVGLRLPGFRLVLRDGAWQRQPANQNLTSDRLNDFAAQWTLAQALSVEAAGRQPALAVIELTVARAEQRNETIAVEVVAYKPTFVLRRRDERLEYHFPEETGKRLLEISGP